MTIRRADFSDEPQIWKIVEPMISPSFRWPRELLLSEFQTTETWVHEKGGQIQAFVCVRDAGEAYEISVLGTQKDWQGQGIMSVLLEAVLEQYNKERQVWLEVHEHNRKAQNLYEKLGFILQRRRPMYYSDGGAAWQYDLPLGSLKKHPG